MLAGPDDRGLQLLSTAVPLREHIPQSAGDTVAAAEYRAVPAELLDYRTIHAYPTKERPHVEAVPGRQQYRR